MPLKVKTFLDEKNIYVSWGILIILLGIAYMVGQTMVKVDQISPFVLKVNNLETDVAVLKTDVANLKSVAHFFDITK